MLTTHLLLPLTFSRIGIENIMRTSALGQRTVFFLAAQRQSVSSRNFFTSPWCASSTGFGTGLHATNRVQRETPDNNAPFNGTIKGGGGGGGDNKERTSRAPRPAAAGKQTRIPSPKPGSRKDTMRGTKADHDIKVLVEKLQVGKYAAATKRGRYYLTDEKHQLNMHKKVVAVERSNSRFDIKVIEGAEVFPVRHLKYITSACAPEYFVPATGPAEAPKASLFPTERLPEVVFAGRSNAGKSSLLNALQSKGATVAISDRPGTTVSLDFYTLDNALTLVDMPGYGFAFASDEKKESWLRMMDLFYRRRHELRCVYVLIDARHGIKATDAEFFTYLNELNRKFHVVVTKSDCVLPSALAALLTYTRQQLERFPMAVKHPLLVVSSHTKAGIVPLLQELAKHAEGYEEACKQAAKEKLKQRK